VLVAPPGTGKTTLVPLALAAAFDADRAGAGCRTAPVGNPGGAARIAALLGEPVGETVGYTVRGDELIIGNVRAWVWAARKLGLGVIELLALSADTMIWRTSAGRRTVRRSVAGLGPCGLPVIGSGPGRGNRDSPTLPRWATVPSALRSQTFTHTCIYCEPFGGYPTAPYGR
jgi:hypothetical protein